MALLVFALFMGLLWGNIRPREQDTEVPVVIFGDSIFGRVRDESSVASVLSQLLEVPVFDGSLGGTALGRLDGEMRLASAKDCLSMEALAQAIVLQDFGVQQTVRMTENGTEHFAATIDELQTIDFSNVEILVMGHGINDYHGGMPIYNEEDPYDKYTFAGALRSALEKLKEEYPHMRIVLATPTYSWYVYEEEPLTCEDRDLGGGVLEDYVDVQMQVAESLGVEVIDLYHDFFPHEEWEDWRLYTVDGVHPNEQGRKLIAEKISRYLKGHES